MNRIVAHFQVTGTCIGYKLVELMLSIPKESEAATCEVA
jgi:hypothetical protein